MQNKTTQLLWIAILFFPLFLQSQTKTITIVSDSSQNINQLTVFDSTLIEELNALLSIRYDVNFKVLGGDYNTAAIKDNFSQAYQDATTDVVIGSGIISSGLLAQRTDFPKPTIAAVVQEEQLAVSVADTNAVSGIENFNYVISPFDLKQNFLTLYQFKPYQKISVLVGKEILESNPSFEKQAETFLDSLNIQIEMVEYKNTADATLNKLSADTEAIFLLPMTNELSSGELETLLLGLQERSLPSIALFGEEMVAKGAFMGYEAAQNLQSIPRRIAINVSKILDGADAAQLPVRISTYNNNLLLNMAAVRRAEVYPDFDFMSDAILINLAQPITDRILTLEGAIIEGLQQNLELKAALKNPLIAQTEVGLARSEYLPQVDISTVINVIDQTRAASSFGATGQVNWLASGSLSQLVYSEPALANIAIQGLLQKSEEQFTEETRLDVVLDVSEAFLGVLQAQSFVEIRNQNLILTRENLNIAEAKLSVGYTGQSDLNRWKSEVANANIDLNNALRDLASAKFRLNQLLNRPVEEEFKVEKTGLDGEILSLLTTEIVPLIGNLGLVEKFANFLVEESQRYLPELKQIDYGIASQRRLLLSQERAFYLPNVAVQGGLDYTIKRFATTDVPPELAQLGLDQGNNKPQWNVNLAVSYPIFQGGRRKLNVQKTELNLLQLNDQRADVANQLELRVRANLRTLSASGAAVQLSEESAKAAAANYQIVQDNYAQGLANITNLIDAQNAIIQSELATTNAGFQFILDYVSLERSVGGYNFLAEPADRENFVQRLKAYLMR